MTVYLFQDIQSGKTRVFKTMKTLCSVNGLNYQTIRKAIKEKNLYMKQPYIIRKFDLE